MNIIANTLQQIFELINGITNDYGLTIVLLTIGIKIILFPLTIKQKKGMKQQQIFNQKAAVLKDKYKNNEKKLNDEMALLMKQEGTGMAGCLVSLLQLPILFGINSVIRNTITASSGSRILPWISSLLIRDPFFILPVITVLLQLLPYTFPYIGFLKALELPKADPKTAIMTILMTIFIGISLPSGVALYYCISSALHAAEQLILNCVETIQVKRANMQQA